ncbi:MAG: methylenetetrahydrofolate reductase C-terminal domain-containing protein [Bacillota bacterium]
MIVAERKGLEEILAMLSGCSRVLVVGCGTCVTVCMAGGEKEVGVLASLLRLATGRDGKPLDVDEATIERQCEWEFVDELAPKIGLYDGVLSMGCGAGVQTIAQRFEGVRVVPALNTKFIGIPEKQGMWVEMCLGCGDCVLDRTGGICPIARCSKNLLNGPCGGSQGGKCEVSKDIDCAWQLIYDRLATLGRLDLLEKELAPKDWSKNRDGGPRKVVREEVML